MFIFIDVEKSFLIKILLLFAYNFLFFFDKYKVTRIGVILLFIHLFKYYLTLTFEQYYIHDKCF